MREKETKMVKFRWSYNTDKETEWLNRMAGQGWAMTGFCLGFYRFERCEPGEYIYQIDETEKFFGVSEDYRQFMVEMGAEIICTWGFSVVLRKKAGEGPFELYTDVESTIERYSKALNVFATAEAIEAACVFSGIFCAVQRYNTFGWVIALAAGLFFLTFQGQTARLKKKVKELKSLREETGIQPEENASSKGLLRGGAIGACALGACVLYDVLHELGHCIAVWLCGGTVTGFYPFGTAGYVTPHMTYQGLTDSFSNGLVDIFGSAVPLAAAVLVLLFWKGSKKHSLLNTCVGIVTGTFLMSTLSWIVEPIGRLANRFDYNSDVSKFMDTTGLHPAVVMLCALLVLGLTCFLFIKRRSRLSLGFVDRKVAVRFSVFLFTIGVLVTLLVYFGKIGAGTILAQGNIKYTVSDSKDPILQGEYELQVTEPGEYICYMDWKLDREGALAGMALKSEDEMYLSSTANWIEGGLGSIYLDSGNYTLCFYLLTCEEDWLEYCEITGTAADNLADYTWESGLPATVTGNYRMMRNMSKENSESAGARTIFKEGNVEYTVSDSKDSILQKEYEFQVTEPGEYVCYVEWRQEQEGAIAAMALKGEDEIVYLHCTGNGVQAEFSPVYLESGSYTLSFYYLTCEEDWLEYCEITGAEEIKLANYTWEPVLPAAVTGSYRIYRSIPE